MDLKRKASSLFSKLLSNSGLLPSKKPERSDVKIWRKGRQDLLWIHFGPLPLLHYLDKQEVSLKVNKHLWWVLRVSYLHETNKKKVNKDISIKIWPMMPQFFWKRIFLKSWSVPFLLFPWNIETNFRKKTN